MDNNKHLINAALEQVALNNKFMIPGRGKKKFTVLHQAQ